MTAMHLLATPINLHARRGRAVADSVNTTQNNRITFLTHTGSGLPTVRFGQ